MKPITGLQYRLLQELGRVPAYLATPEEWDAMLDAAQRGLVRLYPTVVDGSTSLCAAKLPLADLAMKCFEISI